jgi:hypothetical protein
MPEFGRWTSNGGDPSLNEINRSEKFIEALSLEHQVYATDREEAELAVLLAGWRDDARRTPMSGIAPPREAVKALDKATGQGRVRFPMALVGSMAAALLCLGGFGAAVYGSGPGDALYGVRGLVFGSAPVTRDVGVELASSELKQVQQLIDDGQWEEAQQKLQTITTTVATVGDEQRKQELVDQWQQLSVKVETRDPNATVPADAPPVVLPEVTITTTPAPSESTPGETTPTTPSTGPSTSPTETTPGSETSTPSPTSTPSATSTPSEASTSQPTTSQPSSSPTPTPTPSSSAQPTTSAPASQPSTTHTTSAPTTSAAPVAEAPPVTATTVAPSVEPTSVPSAPPVRTTPSAPAETGSGGGHESPSGGNSGEGPALPGIELPLLPGLGGSQR